MTPHPPIDAVITWVDGNDKVHRAKREALLNAPTTPEGMPIIAGRENTRFEDNGELRYCLASIKKFAPWIRRIFLVTDSQTPNFLTPEIMQAYKISIIDHEEIFESFEWALPTFNSISIETVIWRINGLSNNFIYFNDDFILTEAVQPIDFFQNGKVVLHGARHKIPSYGPWRIKFSLLLNLIAKKLFGINRALSLLQQIKAAQIAGSNTHYFRTPHIPHPAQKKTLQDFYENNFEIFCRNIRFPFRDAGQHVSISLANHLEILNKNAIIKESNDEVMICFNRDNKRKITKKIDTLRNKKVRFLCLQSFEESTPRQRETIKCLLNEKLSTTMIFDKKKQ